MQFWSKGLGRRSMVIDIGTEGVEDDGGELVLTGAVKAPVNWNYVIGMRKACWDDFFAIALSPRMAGYMATPKRLGLFVKLTAFVGLFLLTYPFALLSALWSSEGRRPAAVEPESDSGRFMALVAAGRRSHAAPEEEIEEGEAP